jgi:hypothetical protein
MPSDFYWSRWLKAALFLASIVAATIAAWRDTTSWLGMFGKTLAGILAGLLVYFVAFVLRRVFHMAVIAPFVWLLARRGGTHMGSARCSMAVSADSGTAAAISARLSRICSYRLNGTRAH